MMESSGEWGGVEAEGRGGGGGGPIAKWESGRREQKEKGKPKDSLAKGKVFSEREGRIESRRRRRGRRVREGLTVCDLG